MKKIALLIILVVLVCSGCSRDYSKIDDFLNKVVKENDPEKITFTYEMGTFGGKCTWKFEGIKWKQPTEDSEKEKQP